MIALACALVAALGVFLVRRTHGLCRSCGHPGSWSDPLTTVRRHQTHIRHLPVIRESYRASRQAARDAAAADGEAREARDAGRWLAAPAGCCECGTGGPHHNQARVPRGTRYLYADVMARGVGGFDWMACSAHPIAGVVPIVDYGTDVVVSLRQCETDAAAAQAARDPEGGAL